MELDFIGQKYGLLNLVILAVFSFFFFFFFSFFRSTGYVLHAIISFYMDYFQTLYICWKHDEDIHVAF